MANDSEYGLGASIWTQDLHQAERLSDVVESGMVSVNNVVISESEGSVWGRQEKRFWREELSRYGTLEFANIKSVRFYDQLIHHHHVE